MKKTFHMPRRDFVRLGAGSVAAGIAGNKVEILEPKILSASLAHAPSDTVRFGIIGTGTQGCDLLRDSRAVPGIECVAVADLYETRHESARQILKKNVDTTRDYRRLLDRKDLDAVIVATPDHWHRRLVVEAAQAGKDAYCEKPMSHTLEDGFLMIDAVQKNKRILQIGSQRVSSILYAKAKEIWDSGRLGQVDTIEAVWDRNTDSGAWVFPVPPDANENTIDWNTWLGDAPKRPFDGRRFVSWRCYKDYGAGLPGDLFVHLTSAPFPPAGSTTTTTAGNLAISSGPSATTRNSRWCCVATRTTNTRISFSRSTAKKARYSFVAKALRQPWAVAHPSPSARSRRFTSARIIPSAPGLKSSARNISPTGIASIPNLVQARTTWNRRRRFTPLLPATATSPITSRTSSKP